MTAAIIQMHELELKHISAKIASSLLDMFHKEDRAIRTIDVNEKEFIAIMAQEDEKHKKLCEISSLVQELRGIC